MEQHLTDGDDCVYDGLKQDWLQPSRSTDALPRLPAGRECLAAGCDADLSTMPKYCQQRRLCTAHLKAPALYRRDHGDAAFRFCQQCGTLQALEAFDGTKRSCRKSLARRRWSSFKLPTPEATSSEEAATASAAAELESIQSGSRSIRRTVRRSVTTGSLAQRVAVAGGYFQPQLQPMHLLQQVPLEPELGLQPQQQQPDGHMDHRLQAMQARLMQLEQHLLETKRQAAAVAQLDALEQQCRQLGAEFEHHMRSMGVSAGATSHTGHMHPEFLPPAGLGLGPAHSMGLPPLPHTPAISGQLPPMAVVAGNSGALSAPLASAGSDPPGTACITGLLQQEWQGLVRDIELKASLQRTPDTAGSATATPTTAGSNVLPNGSALSAPAAMGQFSWGLEHMHIGGTAATAGGILGGGWPPQQMLVPQQMPAHGQVAFGGAAGGTLATPPPVSMPLPAAMAAGVGAAPTAHAVNGLESFPWEEDVYMGNYMQDACSL